MKRFRMENRIARQNAEAARAILSLFCVTAFFLCRGTVAQTSTAESREEQPAEKVFKNIQVLKGMRAGDLQGAMSFIASSLNVDCDFCHRQDFSQDVTKEKRRAREMILMVRQINQEAFQGKNAVNCFTCHQGHHEPISLAPITPPPPRAPKTEAVTAGTPPGVPLPSVAEVLEHYVQALGGQFALSNVKSRIIRTQPLNGQNSESKTVLYQKSPQKVLLASESPTYSLWVGFDGKRAWAQDSEKSYWGLLNTPQRNSIMRDSELYQGSRIGSQYSSVKVTGKGRIGERETYIVAGTSPEQTSEEFFFDVQSGLLLRRHILEQTVFGGFQIQADFDDYREVGGVKMPFIVRWSSPGGAWGTKTSLRILEVRQNEPIGDDKFDGPPPNSP